jgi:hypothetical protein
MVTISEIYNWYKDTLRSRSPKAPEDATPLQALEWVEQNQKALNEYKDYLAKRNERTFVGEQLTNAVAFVNGIYKTCIIADAFYEKSRNLDKIIEKGETPYPSDIYNTKLVDLFKGEYVDYSPYYDLQIKYIIQYDISHYETIRLIHNNSQIVFDGQILNFEKVSFNYSHYIVSGPMLNPSRSEGTDSAYKITIQLSNIKVIEKYRIDAELLLNEESKEVFERNEQGIKERNRAIDKLNLKMAQKNGLIWGLCGILIGLILGLFFGAILKIFFPNSDNIKFFTILLLILVFGFIGLYFGYLNKRVPKPDWPGKDLIEELFG